MHTKRPRPRGCVRGPAWALACSALLLGCAASPGDPDTDPSWAPLVLAEAWQPAPAGADPMGGHVDADAIACGEEDWQVELDGLEIETTRCNYASLQQPLLADLEQGATLRVRAWWQTLVSPEPVDGHLALFVGDQLVWEEHVAIPGPADVREVEFASPVSAPAGTTVTFHLHNHGSNAWNLNEVALGSSTAANQPEE